MRPGITIVTPVHPARFRNGMFDRAMRSVATQTLPPAALSVAVDVSQQGAPETRDRALRAVQTEWTAFLDSDDMLYPHHLERLYAHAEATRADMVYSWFHVLAGGQLLEHDPVFPETHYTEPFDPENPIETTITTLVRTELALQVGFKALDRGQSNTGEDRRFTLGILELGGKISHLVEKTWIWDHHVLPDGASGNTSGLPTKGDAAL